MAKLPARWRPLIWSSCLTLYQTMAQQERKSSEVIFVMLLEVASPAGTGFPDLFNQPYESYIIYYNYTNRSASTSKASEKECVNTWKWAVSGLSRTKQRLVWDMLAVKRRAGRQRRVRNTRTGQWTSAAQLCPAS